MRTITVKGTGNVKAKADYIEISFYLEAKNRAYEEAVRIASEQIDALKNALRGIGFEKDSLKTSDFSVHTFTESIRDKAGNYKSIFGGYTCRHSMNLSFDFDNERLGRTLSAIAGSEADPNLSIRFTTKDGEAVNDALLRSAAENARRKAEILCTASGAQLGDLIKIDYSWGEIDIYSDTRYNPPIGCMSEAKACFTADIAPDDISVSDTATFVWEIR